MEPIKYSIVDNFDKVFDEKGNTFLALRKIQWGDTGTPKLDIRKWYVNAQGEETVGKGVSFLTEEGPHELTNVLVSEGYGYTEDIIEGLKDRNDFKSSLIKVLGDDIPDEISIDEDELNKEEYYDPLSEIFGWKAAR